jgi:hypothetical protein
MTSTALTAITAQSRPEGITGLPVTGVFVVVVVLVVTGDVGVVFTVVVTEVCGVVTAGVVVSVLFVVFELVTSANGKPPN